MRKTIALLLLTLFDASKSCTAEVIDRLTRNIEKVPNNFFAKAEPNAFAIVQQNLAAPHAEINKLKDKIKQSQGRGADLEMPDFKPNPQKAKPTDFESTGLHTRIYILRTAVKNSVN